MTLSVVGEQTKILQPDWYKDLTDEQLAAYIRYQFIYLNENALDWDSPAHSRVRKRWDGGKHHNGQDYSSTWHEVIRHMRRTNLEQVYPGLWVHAHFSPAAEAKLNASSGLPEIRPASLHSPGRSQAIYSKYLQIGPQILQHRYELAVDTIKLRFQAIESLSLSDADKLAYILCDETHVTATPFFRFVFADRYDCDTALEMYLWEAAIHYEANQPLYDLAAAKSENTWWLTDSLRAAVSEIREHWRQYRG